MGIGIDILSIPRFLRVLQRRGIDKMAQKILSSDELSEFRNVSGQEMYLANRFCVKEAIYKASFPERIYTWKDVTVLKKDCKPTVIVKDAAVFIDVSIAHEQDTVVAVAQFMLK